ncbi:MAG: extracellular solute-binding protein [Planctomycetota bacterium]|nr:extracellular solute-binding protein [Planctomycetota bacterium]
MTCRPTIALCALSLLAACAKEPDLIVYVSHDQIFSQELIQEFEKETGLTVRAEYDTEASKTVGLVRRLREESSNPRCDVFWNNEVAHTVSLAEEGMFQPYDSPHAADIPALFRDPDHRWTGFAARARCLIVNTDLVSEADMPSSMWDLLDPKWKGKCGIARPLTGTTLTHATALYDILGEAEAERFWSTIAGAQSEDPPQVNVVGSNGQLMRLVATGQLHWGFTDTDDFNVARDKEDPVRRILPDQDGDDPMGTLLIPNTVAILKDAPHLSAAKRFVDWALSRELEQRMAESRSAQIPVRDDVPRPAHVARGFETMQVSYVSIGRQIEKRAEHLRVLFLE